MSDPYLGEIRMFAFSRIPQGWLACDGSLRAIADDDALYSLLGTRFGGDGSATFGLPDLRGQLPIHRGQGVGLSNYVLGQRAGTETVQLTPAQMPSHTHVMTVTTASATSLTPGTTLLPASVAGDTLYVDTVTGANSVAMSNQMISASGASASHENCMPSLPVQFCIARNGTYPTQG